ncbi:response regulator [Thalassolituus sp.]|uniref:response regulator n=1 Tax=Thalassolituus sp. TaxID=2030822 RepID=UPI0035166DD1
MLIKNALIVDDSKSARLVLQRLLARIHVSVDTVESAEEALAFLEHRQPDIIFMDHMMPGMDGLEAKQMIRANPKTSRIPTIMYTSKDGEDYFRIALQKGANGVLCKPADQEAVMAVIRSLDKPAANDASKEPAPVESLNIPLIEIDRLVQKHLRTALTEAKSEISAGIDLTASQLQQHQKHQLEIIRRQLQQQVNEVQNDLNTELDSERLFNRTRNSNQKLAAAVADRITKRSADELASKLQIQKMAFDSALEDHKRETDKHVRSVALRAAIAGASIGIFAAVIAASIIR